MTDAAKQLSIIHSLSRAIAQAKDPSEVYNLIINELATALNVGRASLMVYDAERDGLVIAAAKGMDTKTAGNIVVRMGEGISGKVFAERRPLLVKDIKAEQRGVGKYKSSSLMSAPVVCSPLKMGDEPLGVINVTDRVDGKQFSDDDLSLLTLVADLTASYVHLTRMAKELKRSEQIRQELEIARNIQYRLLPARPPEVADLDVAGRCLTAERVGGDYYDYFAGANPMFAVADVSGHSIGAALIMAAFRAAIRSQLSLDDDIASATKNLNKILYEDLFQAEQFVSLVMVEYLSKRREIRFTTAGHPPLLLWKPSKNKFEKLFTDDPLIGIDFMAEYSRSTAKFDKGDILLMYSDGLVESSNDRGNRFGWDRVEQVMKSSGSETAAGILENMMSTLLDFTQPIPFKDDVTLVVIKAL